jgi:hypothetical protein
LHDRTNKNLEEKENINFQKLLEQLNSTIYETIPTDPLPPTAQMIKVKFNESLKLF